MGRLVKLESDVHELQVGKVLTCETADSIPSFLPAEKPDEKFLGLLPLTPSGVRTDLVSPNKSWSTG